MQENNIHIEHVRNGGRNVLESIHWMDTAKSTTRHMSFKGVFGMVSYVKVTIKFN